MRYLICLLTLILLISSCQEIGPTVNIIPPARKVLVEEFTGVQCTNCPEGSEKLETLLDQHGENLVVVSIHSGFFSIPLAESVEDFRTTDADNLDNLIGPVTAYPSASVNRNLFSGEGSRIVNANTWAGYIADELARPSRLEMELTKTYVGNSRELTAEVSIVFFEDIAEPINLTMYLTETNITDAQFTPTGIETDYTHKHVFRTALTPFNGQLIPNPSTTSPYTQSLSFTIPTEWDAANCSIIAFVHGASPNIEVEQVEEIYVID